MIAIGTRMQNQGGGGEVEWDGRSWGAVKAPATINRTPQPAQFGPAAPGRQTVAGAIAAQRQLPTAAPQPAVAGRPDGTGAPSIQRTPQQQAQARPAGSGAPGSRKLMSFGEPLGMAPAPHAAGIGSALNLVQRATDESKYAENARLGGAIYRNNPNAAAAYDREYAALNQVDPITRATIARRRADEVAGQQPAPQEAQVNPAILENIQRGAAQAGEQRANVGDPNQKLTWVVDASGVGRWEDSNSAAAQASINRTVQQAAPRQEAIPAAPTKSDYIPPKESRFESVPGFDQKKYMDLYLTGQRGAVSQAYSDDIKRIREEMALRGLSQQGMSGFELGAIERANMERQNALGRVEREAQQKAMEMGREDEWKRAGQLDNYALARGGYGLSYAQDNRAANREDAMLPLDVRGKEIANTGAQESNDFFHETRAARRSVIESQAKNAEIGAAVSQATLDSTIANARISTEMAQLGLKTAQMEAELAGSTFEEMKVAKLAELRAAIAQNKLSEWESVNAGWLGVLKFGGSVAKGAIEAAAAGAAGGTYKGSDTTGGPARTASTSEPADIIKRTKYGAGG